jgi:dipeptidyl-peptidase-4
MFAKRLISVLAAISIAAPAAAQVPELSVQAIYGSDELGSDLVRVTWMDDGQHFTSIERTEDGATDLYSVEARSGERELLVSGADLVPPGSEEPITIASYRFSADGSKLLIGTSVERIWRRSSDAIYYVWDFDTQRLTAVSSEPGRQSYAKLSPDGTRVAFVRDNDIYVSDLASGQETALTEDGDENIINGTTDWVYEEELSLADGFRWSPDGQRIAFWRFDQSAIAPFYLIDLTVLYPELKPVRYPKAGMANSEVRLGVIELASGATTWVDVTPDYGEFYIARMDFTDSSDEIWFQRLNRHQSRMDLMLANVRTGASRLIMTDTDEAWLDIDFNSLVWIDDGERFVYLSERDGYGHLYLFDRDGSLVRKLTSGEWDVQSTYGADEQNGVVYFTGSADGPLVRPLYSVGLDGRGFRRISGAAGSHQVSFDPTFTYYVDTYSDAGTPPVQTLRSADGEEVRILADNAQLREKLEGLELSPPEFLTIQIDEGVELNAWLIKPPDFDPTEQYPLLMYVYGGPGSQTVRDSWGGSRYLWHQLLAKQGYLIASVDNRGTGGRGVEFKKITYLNLGEYESNDQIAAARYFAGLPYVDGSRIGIWGWSYGGYMASLTLFKGADVFKAAIAGAPVTDWRLYDTIYTERYMRTPQENPDGYARSAPLAYADRLQGRLLLIHGTGDDNVHMQNTLQLVDRLIAADKQFELRLYPNHPHGIRGRVPRVNLYTMMTNFVKENL